MKQDQLSKRVIVPDKSQPLMSVARALRFLRDPIGWVRRQRHGLPGRLLALGISPRVLGWRAIRHISPDHHVAEMGKPGDLMTLAPAKTFANALPINVVDRASLNSDPGWWGYSMHDVPERTSTATRLAVLTDVTVLAFLDGKKREFTPAIVDKPGRSVALPQVRFRPGHSAMMRAGAPVVEMDEAVWFLERVYDNHSHWLTAHLPKLLMLRDQGVLEKTIMPARRNAAIEASLAMIGIDPTAMPQYAAGSLLKVGRLIVPITDRFDPRHLRRVREVFSGDAADLPRRRVFISRARAQGRKLLNEDVLWPALRDHGFERVFMEALNFPAQVRLMQQTAVIVAPHGAGLTNMIFCPEKADIVEIADPDYPNPNFYALSAAMNHRFWLLAARAKGEGHALHKDLTVEVPDVLDVVSRIEALRGEA